MNYKAEELTDLMGRVAKGIAREPEKMEVEMEAIGPVVRIAFRPGRPGDVGMLIGKFGAIFRTLQRLTQVLGERMGLNATLTTVLDNKKAVHDGSFVPTLDPKAWADEPTVRKLVTDMLDASGTQYTSFEEYDGAIAGARVSKTYRFEGVTWPHGVTKGSQKELMDLIRETVAILGRANGVDIAIDFQVNA